MKKVSPHTDDSPSHILPFYSNRTLEEIHDLITDMSDGLAVYISKDRIFATIGTRGIRPMDGAPGLIIHLSVNLRDENTTAKSQRIILKQPVHNLACTKATAVELVDLLMRTLEESGFVRSGWRSDAGSLRFF